MNLEVDDSPILCFLINPAPISQLNSKYLISDYSIARACEIPVVLLYVS
jgi:hypothetical protein